MFTKIWRFIFNTIMWLVVSKYWTPCDLSSRQVAMKSYDVTKLGKLCAHFIIEKKNWEKITLPWSVRLGKNFMFIRSKHPHNDIIKPSMIYGLLWVVITHFNWSIFIYLFLQTQVLYIYTHTHLLQYEQAFFIQNFTKIKFHNNLQTKDLKFVVHVTIRYM